MVVVVVEGGGDVCWDVLRKRLAGFSEGVWLEAAVAEVDGDGGR